MQPAAARIRFAVDVDVALAGNSCVDKLFVKHFGHWQVFGKGCKQTVSGRQNTLELQHNMQCKKFQIFEDMLDEAILISNLSEFEINIRMVSYNLNILFYQDFFIFLIYIFFNSVNEINYILSCTWNI